MVRRVCIHHQRCNPIAIGPQAKEKLLINSRIKNQDQQLRLRGAGRDGLKRKEVGGRGPGTLQIASGPVKLIYTPLQKSCELISWIDQ